MSTHLYDSQLVQNYSTKYLNRLEVTCKMQKYLKNFMLTAIQSILSLDRNFPETDNQSWSPPSEILQSIILS